MQQEQEQQSIDFLRILRNKFPIIFLIFLVCAVTAIVLANTIDKKYASSTQLQIHMPNKGLKVFDESLGSKGDSTFLRTQFEILKSPETLRYVVDDLKLNEVYNESVEASISRIQRGIKTQNQLGTDLVSISVEMDDANNAYDVCNSLIESYGERRLSLERVKILKQLGDLESEIEIQEELVNEYQAKVDEIMRTYQLVRTPNSVDGGATVRTSNRSREHVEQQIIELEERKEQLRSALKSMEGRNNEDLVQFVSTLTFPGNRVSKLYPEWLEADREIIAMETQGFGAKHPRVVTLKKIQEERWQGILDAIDDVKASSDEVLNNLDIQIVQFKAMSKDRLSNAVEDSIAYNKYEEAQRALQTAKMSLSAMNVKLIKQRVQLKVDQFPFDIHAQPKLLTGHIFPKFNIFLVVGCVAGLLLGCGSAIVLELSDNTVSTIQEVEDSIESSVLAVVPSGVGLLYNEVTSTPDAEAYRILRTNLEFQLTDRTKNCFTLTSGSAGEGKSTTICNLATVFAQAGHKTLLIDGDLRRPTIARKLDLPNQLGLSNIFHQKLPAEEVIMPTKVDNLFCMTSGTATLDPSILLGSNDMKTLLTQLKKDYDFVFIDSPPILGLSDSASIANLSDHVLVVVQHRKLPKQMISKIKDAVANAGGEIIGVLMNNVDVKSDAQYEYYTSYYSYYSTSTNEAAPAAVSNLETKKPTASASKSNEEIY